MPFHEPPPEELDASFDDLWCFFCEAQDRDLRALRAKEELLKEL